MLSYPVTKQHPHDCLQAESDHHVRDTYNYMTVQTDIAMPKRQLKIVEDSVRQSAWATAIKDSVRAIMAEDKDCRVLDLAAGAGKEDLPLRLCIWPWAMLFEPQ